MGSVFSGAHCKETGEAELKSRAQSVLPRGNLSGLQLAVTPPRVKGYNCPEAEAGLGEGMLQGALVCVVGSQHLLSPACSPVPP